MRKLLAILLGLTLLVGAAGCGPEGAVCKQEGARKYTSKDGTLVCKENPSMHGYTWQ